MTSVSSLLYKEELIFYLRQFFVEQGFTEITVPVLNSGLPVETNLYAFETKWRHLQNSRSYYLPTSPESALKKALALGIDKVFAIAKSFRNQDPIDQDHHPEFLMLEWYRSDANYQDIMQDIEALLIFLLSKLKPNGHNHSLIYQGQSCKLNTPWPRLKLADLFYQHFKKPLNNFLTLPKLKQFASQLGLSTANSTWEQLFNQIFLSYLEPLVGFDSVFVTDYPKSISPLCKSLVQDSNYAQRFEWYLAGKELANGNTEALDAEFIEKSFKQEQAFRLKNKLPTHPIDQELISALSKLNQTQQSFAGVGLGIERLAMILADKTSIQDFRI